MPTYNIYEAKTSFSRLVEQATSGEEVVIAKAGKPLLRLVPIVEEKAKPRRVFGQNVMGIGAIPEESYEDLPLDMWEALADEPASDDGIEQPDNPR